MTAEVGWGWRRFFALLSLAFRAAQVLAVFCGVAEFRCFWSPSSILGSGESGMSVVGTRAACGLSPLTLDVLNMCGSWQSIRQVPHTSVAAVRTGLRDCLYWLEDEKRLPSLVRSSIPPLLAQSRPHYVRSSATANARTSCPVSSTSARNSPSRYTRLRPFCSPNVVFWHGASACPFACGTLASVGAKRGGSNPKPRCPPSPPRPPGTVLLRHRPPEWDIVQPQQVQQAMLRQFFRDLR